ncbi:MAG: PEP-CTERM-box response regulator transcription factor [Geminicoccaceae bacterium]
MRKLLLVDDDPGILRALRWTFGEYELLTAPDRRSAVEQVRRHKPAVVTLDLGLPPAVDDAGEGLATLDEILTLAPATKVIVVTGQEDRGSALAAVGRGALDFYSKPIDAEILGLIVARAFHVHELEAENRHLKTGTTATAFGILTGDSGMLTVCRTIEKIAPVDASVLITGESGTGKELVARALHAASGRRNGAFVAINCAAIPENLLESELFGFEKGAFTGAVRQTRGKIELADGGTLFLDEIGDMPPALQAKLLRFLQERQIERLGGRGAIPVDVRILSATHRDLAQMIRLGSFREDLFYRLAQLSLAVPPLRDRGDDAVLIARHLLERFAVEQKKRAPRLARDAVTAISRHAWSGNIRELENRIRRAVILNENGELSAADLDLHTPDCDASEIPEESTMSLRQAREIAERKIVANALHRTGGNLTAAARLLKVSRPTLYSLLRQYDLALSDAASGT